VFWEEHERLAKRKERPQTEGMFGIPCLGAAISAKDLPRSATFAFRRSIRSGPRTLADTSNIARIPSRLSVLRSTSATLVSAKPTPPLILVFLDLLRRLTALVSW
jgi:hypothetical protein